MEFAADARQLLKWATWIALDARAQGVDTIHLKDSIRAALQ